jgi:hypothetical protein
MVDRELADFIERVGEEAVVRAIMVTAIVSAIEGSGVALPEVILELRALTQGASVDANKLHRIVEEIDERYFDLKDSADNGQASPDAYKPVFRQARAVSALVMSQNVKLRSAASESIYEAYHALDEQSEFLNRLKRMAQIDN